jgi:hypothetical protein
LQQAERASSAGLTAVVLQTLLDALEVGGKGSSGYCAATVTGLGLSNGSQCGPPDWSAPLRVDR